MTEVSLRYALGRFIYTGCRAVGHIRVMVLRGLLELLKVHGFTIVHVSASGAPFPKDLRLPGLRPIKFFDRIISRLFPALGPDLIIEAKKE